MEVIVDGIIYQLQSYGGISRIYSEILPRMCQADETLDITLLMTGKSQQALPHHPHIHVYSAPQIEKFLKPGFIWQRIIKGLQERWLQATVGSTEGKIWHSTYYTAPKSWNGVIVVTVADMVAELFPELFNTAGSEQAREQKRRCVLSADAVICISESTRNDVLRFYEVDPDNVLVVPLACGDVFKQHTNPPKDTGSPVSGPFLLYVGSRSQYKNFRQLVEAYSLWQHRDEVSLVVVGSNWSPDEIESLTALNIYEQVHLLDTVDDDTLCNLYNRAAAFIYPSLYEGFGIPLLEAMACGCPVIASRIPSTVEVADDCPVYFDPGETEELVAALDTVLSEGRDSERSRLGLEHVKKYSWQITTEKTLEVYHSLSNS